MPHPMPHPTPHSPTPTLSPTPTALPTPAPTHSRLQGLLAALMLALVPCVALAQTDAPAAAVTRSALREQAIAVLTELASSQSPQVRANALEGLSRAPARLEQAAARGIRDPNEGVRSVAAMVTGRARLHSLAPAIEPLIHDPSPYVRASAIGALHTLGRGVDPTPLASLLLEHPEPGVRAHTAWTLGEMGDRSAVGLLRAGAISPMPRASLGSSRLFRLQVAEALFKLGEDGELHTLHAALFPSSPDELEAAALASQILGSVRSRRSIPELKNIVVWRDERGGRMPPEIRLAALRSLGQLGERSGLFIAEEYANATEPLVRAQLALALGQCDGPDVLDRLSAMMAPTEPEIVRVAAATGALEQTEPRAAQR